MTLPSRTRNLRGVLGRFRDETGAATIEFVFLGIMVLVPLLYLLVAVFELQRNVFAVTQAAREAGRAVASADNVNTGVDRAVFAVRLALQDQNLDTSEALLRFVQHNQSCDNGPVAPAPGAATLEPGAEFVACVVQVFTVPGVPSFLDSSRNTVTGRFVVHVDTYRTAAV